MSVPSDVDSTEIHGDHLQNEAATSKSPLYASITYGSRAGPD